MKKALSISMGVYEILSEASKKYKKKPEKWIEDIVKNTSRRCKAMKKYGLYEKVRRD